MIIYISLEYKRSRLSFVPILLCLVGAVFSDETADSLAFSAKRKQILESAPDERATLILAAADDLARDGFHAEALELVFSMEDGTASDWEDVFPDSVPAAAAVSDKSPSNAYGYIQSTLDYDDWEGQTTPFAGRLRAKLEWDPEGPVLDRISGVFQGSDRNAYFEFTGKGNAFGRMLKIEADILAEKRMWQTYGDSLDRVFLWARAEANTRSMGKPLSLVFPIYGEAQQYRFDRPGSLSSRSFSATPGLEAVSEDLRKSLILSWELRRTAYPSSPSAGNFRNGPVALAEWYGNRITVDGEARYQSTSYMRDTSRYRVRGWETRGGAFVKAWPWLRAGFRTSGETEIGDYRDSVELGDSQIVQAAYQVNGLEWTLQPQLIAEWSHAYSVSASLAFTRGRYPFLYQAEGRALMRPKYLLESFDDWKPGLSFTYLSKTIFFTLSAAYEENWVVYSPEYSLGSSRGVDANCNLFWKFLPRVEVDFSGLASHRLDKGTAPGRIQNMTSVSLGLTSRFP